MGIETFEMQLVEVQDLTPRVKHFVFQRSTPFHFTPGQFVRLFFPGEDAKPRSRSYSLANTTTGTPYIEFAASYVPGGVASECLFNLPIGATLKCAGPIGKLVLPETLTANNLVFLATNTGITPFRSMLELFPQLLNTYPNLHIHIFEGVRHKVDALYENDFVNLANLHPRCHFYLCYSSVSEAEITAPHARAGYVQSQLSCIDLQCEKDMVYLCGNPNMIDNASSQLQAQGFPLSSLKREKYISSK